MSLNYILAVRLEQKMSQDKLYLNPKLTIIYEDKRGDETEHIEYHEPEGIIGFVKDLNKNIEKLHDVIYFTGES